MSDIYDHLRDIEGEHRIPSLELDGQSLEYLELLHVSCHVLLDLLADYPDPESGGVR